MGALDETIKMINLRVAARNTPQVKDPEFARTLDTVNGGFLRPEDVRDSLVALARAVAHIQVGVDAAMAEAKAAQARNERIIKGLGPALGGINQSLGKKPESFDPITQHVSASIAEVKGQIDRLIKAINGIQLPEVKIPDYPVPKEVDLSVVLDELGRIKKIVSTPQAKEDETPKVTRWVHEVKRNASGFIKTIESVASNESPAS